MNPRIRPHVQRLNAYVPGEQPTGTSVIKLNTNENPYPPAPGVLVALGAPPEQWCRLYPDPLALRLRQSIATLHSCTPGHVCCGNGSDELLALAIRAFAPSHGAVGFFDPSYSLYPVLARIADVATAPIPLAPDFSCPPIPKAYDVPLFFWTNPNAPTSLLCRMEAIRDFAEGSGGVVLVDEAYVDFAETNAVELALSLPNVLVTRTFSKSYSLAGLRLGYALGHPDLIGALLKVKDAYNINRLTQEAGLAAVADQAHMQANIYRIINTRVRITRELEKRGFEVTPSQTNFLWIKPPHASARDLFRTLRDREIYVRYFDAPATAMHLRVTVGTDSQMDAFLAAFDA